MVLRHNPSAYWAEDVHTSFRILCELAYLIGTTTLFACSNLCLIVASMIFHSRMMYASNGTGQLASVFSLLLVPIMRYHVFVVKFDYTMVGWSFLYHWILHYVLISYLCTSFGHSGHIASWYLSFSITCVLYVHCVFRVAIVFTSWNIFHIDIMWFQVFPVVLVLLRYPRHVVGSMYSYGSRSSVIAATMPCPCDVLTLATMYSTHSSLHPFVCD